MNCTWCKKPAEYVHNDRAFCSLTCGVAWVNQLLGSTLTEEDLTMEDFFGDGYKPELVTDDFGAIIGKRDCAVNWARWEEYGGDKEELEGEQFRYEVEVLDGQENKGGRLWYTANPKDKSTNSKGKTKMERLADAFFTLGMEFKNKEELEKCAEKFCEMSVRVFAGEFFPDPTDKNNGIQWHKILGKADANAGRVEKKEKADSPF